MVRRDYYKVDRPPSAEFLFVTIRGPRPRVEGEPRKVIKWEISSNKIILNSRYKWGISDASLPLLINFYTSICTILNFYENQIKDKIRGKVTNCSWWRELELSRAVGFYNGYFNGLFYLVLSSPVSRLNILSQTWSRISIK